MSDTKKSVEDLIPSDEFYKIINDFTSDIVITFPEYSGLISKWWNRPSNNVEESKKKETLFVFRHCVKIFPERFFDVLYKNVDMFKEESDVTTEFLPGIVFKQLWILDISDKTKETIWKYLQLILFSVIGSVNSTSELGDTAKLFEEINEEELKKKLEETLEGMQNLFETKKDSSGMDSNINMENMPNAEQLHEHINSMMGGKLGKLALELAEDTAKDLNLDMDNTGDAKDVFQKLFKNPGKMMNMVKNIGSKIDEKIKSGEIKESELMEEGMELLNKMKNMPGMENIQSMLSKMGMGDLANFGNMGGLGGKVNVGAMEAQLNKSMKLAQTKERIKAKSAANQKARNDQSQTPSPISDMPAISEEEIIKIFSTGEKVDKTPRNASQPQKTGEGKKKKKGKK